jgi:hypothetical protein
MKVVVELRGIMPRLGHRLSIGAWRMERKQCLLVNIRLEKTMLNPIIDSTSGSRSYRVQTFIKRCKPNPKESHIKERWDHFVILAQQTEARRNTP